MRFIMKLATLLKIRIEAKNIYIYIYIYIYRVLEFNQPHWLKPYVEFNTQKRIEREKKW